MPAVFFERIDIEKAAPLGAAFSVLIFGFQLKIGL